MQPCCVSGTIITHRSLTPSIYEMVIEYDRVMDFIPGQFINLKIPPYYLRRPLSVTDWDGKRLTLLYKVVGQGTDRLSQYHPGQTIDTLMPLGNGFDCDQPIDLLIAGGMGVAPLYGLAKAMIQNHPVTAILGFRNAQEAIYIDRYHALGVNVIVTSDDGSIGLHGSVMAGLATIDISGYHHYASCGPAIMMRSIATSVDLPGQVSLESRMGCGFGACMGCSIQLNDGYARVCTEGPIFDPKEVIWESLK